MRLLSLLGLLLFSVGLWAQPFIITQNITLEQGLLANDVRTLFIDDKGILYIGSRSGLSTIAQGKILPYPSALANKFTNITAILQDKYGAMWFGSYGQGILYQRNSFSSPEIINKELPSDRITSFYEYENDIYVGTSKGVSRINAKNHQVVSIPSPKIDSLDFQISGFFEIREKLYLTTINHGTYHVGEKNLTLLNSIENIYSVYALDNKVFYGRKDGLVIYDINTNDYQYYNGIPAIRDFYNIDGSVFFVSAGAFENRGGIYRYNGVDIEDLTAQMNISSSILYSLVYNAKHSLLYIGSMEHGVFEVDLFSALEVETKFKNIIYVNEQANNLYIVEKDGFYIKKGNDTWRQILSSQDFKSYQEKNDYKHKETAVFSNHFFPIDYSIPAHKIIYYKVVQEKGVYYVSTNIGLFKFSASGHILDYYNIHTYEFAFFKGKLIETIPYDGVRIYTDLPSMEYTYYSNYLSEDIPENIVDIEVFSDQLYLASALNGLFTYSEDKGFNSLYKQGVFQENRLKFLAVKDEHSLYIATDATDIFQLQDRDSMITIDFVVGAPKIQGSNISVIAALKDRILIATDKGLNVFSQHESFYFDKDQGLRQVPILSSFVTNDKIFLGTTNALNTILLENFQKKHKPLSAQITKLLINGELYDLQNIDQNKPFFIDLASRNNSLQVSFDVLGSKFSNKLDFQYRLKDNEHWHSINDSKIDLHYLNSGSYNIELRVKDYDSGTEFVFNLLSFKIAPLFVDTLIFKVILVLIVFSILALLVVIKYVIEGKKNREREKNLRYEKRLAEVRLLSIRSQINSHFIFNVLSSIQYFIVTGSQDEAFDYLGKFAKLIRTSLTFSALERVTLTQEIAYLEKYIEIENMRLEGRVQFIVNCQIDTNQVQLPPMLIQPFIENALIHAFPSSIKEPLLSLTIKGQGVNVLIVIQDNGIGVGSPKLQKQGHQSKGVSIVRERMSLIQEYLEEDLKIEMNEQGTKVSLLLRYKLKP